MRRLPRPTGRRHRQGVCVPAAGPADGQPPRRRPGSRPRHPRL